MTLQQLKYLIGIADSGLNITAAAERLYTSQPGISKQLKQLEQELGLAIFTRKGKALAEITPAGNEVIARARRILREAENIRALAGELAREQEGTLAIGTTHTQARYVLPDVIRDFRERYPGVSLELHQGTSEQIAEMVGNQQVDFALATGSRALFPDLVLLPCYRWDRVVVVPKNHELCRLSGRLDLPTLVKFPLITYVFSSRGESSFKNAFALQSLEPDVVFTARDADVIKTYVRMGMGVGVVASMAYDCADAEDLSYIDARGLFPRLTTWIGFPRETVLRSYMIDFISLFAPQLIPEHTRKAAECADQAAVDGLFEDVLLPLRTGCGENAPGAVSEARDDTRPTQSS